ATASRGGRGVGGGTESHRTHALAAGVHEVKPLGVSHENVAMALSDQLFRGRPAGVEMSAPYGQQRVPKSRRSSSPKGSVAMRSTYLTFLIQLRMPAWRRALGRATGVPAVAIKNATTRTAIREVHGAARTDVNSTVPIDGGAKRGGASRLDCGYRAVLSQCAVRIEHRATAPVACRENAMTSSRGNRLPIVAGLALLALGTAAHAEVTGITFTKSSPYGTTTFGTAGIYEQLDGVVTGEINPHHPLNRIIQDIERAPRNVRGNVEYAMTFSILKPVDLANSNHTLVYDVVNRGNKLITSFLNVGTSATNPAGDGFLQKQGFILVWSGWQADALAGGGRQVMTVVPVA